MQSFVFGPVPSRRLGLSLGISPIPQKTCNYRCVYCQLGHTTNYTNLRQEFFPKEKIFDEIRHALQKVKNHDYITFVGEGEPTLCKDLGWLIEKTKKICSQPVCVITNGALLSNPQVRSELSSADVILPSFDAGNPQLFQKVNHPHRMIKFKAVVDGFLKFREEFDNQIWIEIMLVKDLNDSLKALEEIQGFLEIFKPDKIQINTPTRPPALKWVKSPDNDTIKKAEIILKASTALPLNEIGNIDPSLFKNPVEALSKITRRHPLRWDQALEIIKKMTKEENEELLRTLIESNKFKIYEYRGRQFIYEK